MEKCGVDFIMSLLESDMELKTIMNSFQLGASLATMFSVFLILM